MKKSRLLISLLLALVMAFAICLVACNNNDDPNKDPDKDPDGDTPTTQLAITDGYFDGSYDPGNNNPKQIAVMRFHRNGEIIAEKQTFYFYIESSNQAMFGPMLGLYEVKDETVTKTIFADRAAQTAENAVGIEATASKKLVLKTLEGEAFYEMGYDVANNRVFGFDESDAASLGLRSYYCGYCYNQKNETLEEKGVALATYFANVGDVKNASIEIYHNGTYADNKVTGSANVKGKWTKDGNVYTLTPDSNTNKGGVLTVDSTDSTKATFVPTGETAIEMGPMSRTALYTLTGKGSVTSGGYTLEVEYSLALNDDNSAILSSQSQAGNNEFTGEWIEGTETGMIAVVTIPGVDPFTVTKSSDGNGSFVSAEVLGVTLKQEIEEEKSTLQYILSGKVSSYFDATIELFDDGEAVYTVKMPENYGGTSITKGTWTETAGAISGKFVAGQQELPFTVTNTNGVLTSEINGTTFTMNPEYVLTGKVSNYFDASIVMYETGLCVYTVNMPEAYGGTSVTKGTWAETAGAISGKFVVAEQELPFTVTNNGGVLSTEINGTAFYGTVAE